jgi:hypothetical protein
VVAAAAFFTVRYYGYRAGWWPALLPMREVTAELHAMWSSIHALFARIYVWLSH